MQKIKIKVFYLSSKHNDSAKDHKNYQGKMYVDENWAVIPMPYGIHTAIQNYIKTHRVRTIQWVVGRPVWLITRPNCRHYFQELSVKEVLGTSRRNLIKEYDMKSAIGNREYLQTINHSTRYEWYKSVRNAELLVESYKRRLEMHELMYRENPCQLIRKAIVKDKFLIKKWQDFIQEKWGNN